jgi:hypothetical protein
MQGNGMKTTGKMDEDEDMDGGGSDDNDDDSDSDDSDDKCGNKPTKRENIFKDMYVNGSDLSFKILSISRLNTTNCNEDFIGGAG